MTFNAIHISHYLKDPVRQFQLSFLLRQAAVLLGSVLITNSVLSLEQIGRLEWLFYVGYMGTFFWSNGLLQSCLKSTPGESSEHRSALLWGVFKSKTVLAAIWFLGMLLFYPLIREDLQIGIVYYLMFLFWISGNVLSAYLPFHYFRNHFYTNLMLYNLLYFFIYAVIFIVFMYKGENLETLLTALGIFGLILIGSTTIAALSTRKNDVTLSISSSILTAMPLIGYALMAGLAVVTDGWLVKFWSNNVEVFAIYRYGARELPLSLAASVALSGAVVPLLSNSLESGLEQLKKRAVSWMHILFPVSIVLVLVSTYLFDLLYGERFSDSVVLFDIMLLLVISRLLFPQSILLAKGDYALIFKVSVLEIILNITVSILLMAYFGLIGIVAGTVIAFLFEKLIMIFIIRKKYQIPLSSYHSLNAHVLYSVLLCIAFASKYIIQFS